MSWKATIRRNVVWNTAGLAVEITTGFLVLPFLLAKLGETTYGVWLVLAAITSYFGLFGTWCPRVNWPLYCSLPFNRRSGGLKSDADLRAHPPPRHRSGFGSRLAPLRTAVLSVLRHPPWRARRCELRVQTCCRELRGPPLRRRFRRGPLGISAVRLVERGRYPGVAPCRG